MDRNELRSYILENYAAAADFPWVSSPENEVFRHENSGKWFALVMELSADKLGLAGAETMTVVNLKCDPLLIGSLREERGFFPAYHMNKEHWITAVLDGSAPDAQIQTLLAMSYDMTAPGHGRTVKKRNENQAAAQHLR